MTSTIGLTSIAPAVDPLWEALIDRYPTNLFLAPPWLAALEDTYGIRVEASVLVDDGGAPLAGLPYVVLRDPRGPRINALPFCDYCDPPVASMEQWNAVVAPLLEAGLPIAIRTLHNTIPHQDPRFPLAKQARWHGLDISSDLDALWTGIDSSARRAIRKAEKSGVTVRLALDEADLRAFFELHLGIRKYKYALLAQPYRFFEAIRERFLADGRFALMLAEAGGEVVGGVMYLEWGDTLFYKLSASSLQRLELRPTDLLIWEGIKLAKERNLEAIDFGLSDWDQEGLVRYKRKFASVEGTISFLHHSSERESTPEERQVGAMLGRLTELFTDPRVPDDISERAGAMLYGLFG